jgi:hypothetical protein
VAHTIFAHVFRNSGPRWADEGMDMLSEDEEEQIRHAKLVRQTLDLPGTAVPLRRFLAWWDYPSNGTEQIRVFYAQAYSLTRFLVDQKGHQPFLHFVRDGTDQGWEQAVQRHYGYRSFADLEMAWLARLDEERRKEAPDQHRTSNAKDRQRVPSGPMPVTALAAVDAKGRLLVRLPVNMVVPRRGIQPLPDGSEQEITYYEQVTTGRDWVVSLDEVQGYRPDGSRLTAQQLRKQLHKEVAVLIAVDSRPVDPFHLQVIKEGTVILVLPRYQPPTQPAPAVAATPPVAAPPAPPGYVTPPAVSPVPPLPSQPAQTAPPLRRY